MESDQVCLAGNVLIETLWNVKYGLQGRTDYKWYVLIETLWNVKVLPGATTEQAQQSINRNIVECKAVKCNILMCICVICINRNIVECKESH